MSESLAWKMYERLVTAFEIDSAEMDASVTPNASLVGSISGRRRQIDVLVDARWKDGTERRIVFDAKKRKRKVDVKEVEAFEGLMRDVRASRGVLVCASGYSKAALRRARQSIEIRLLRPDDALATEYAAIDPCGNCAVENRRPPGLVFWDGQFPLPIVPGWAVVFTGKCDVCRSFAFWCWDCGEKVVVPDGESYVCGCERKWFTERSGGEVIFVVAVEGGEALLDRRPLR